MAIIAIKNSQAAIPVIPELDPSPDRPRRQARSGNTIRLPNSGLAAFLPNPVIPKAYMEHGAGTIAHAYAPHAPCIFIQSVVVARELENASHVRNDMMYADRQFEFTVDDGGLPGVFLPKVTVVRGVLSASAHECLLQDGQDLDEGGRQKLLHRAVRRRFIINGAEIRLIDVRASDITAVREETEPCPMPHAPWQRVEGRG